MSWREPRGKLYEAVVWRNNSVDQCVKSLHKAGETKKCGKSDIYLIYKECGIKKQKNHSYSVCVVKVVTLIVISGNIQVKRSISGKSANHMQWPEAVGQHVH